MSKGKDVIDDNAKINKEEIALEIKNEVKEELLKELPGKIDVEIGNKLDKMEKRIFKQKQKVIFKKNIVILLLLGLVIFEGKVLYDNGFLDKNKNSGKGDSNVIDKTDDTNGNDKNDTIDNSKSLEWYIENYSYLLNNIKTNLSGDDEYYLYKDNYNVDKIKNTVKLNMAYQLLDSTNIIDENGFITFDSTKLSEAYQKLFMDQYTPENFSNGCINYIYNKDLDKYLAISIVCDDDLVNKLEKIVNIEEVDKKIIITTVLGLYNKNDNTLTDLDGINSYLYNDNLLEYKDKLPNYKYTFRNIDGNYYLESISKISFDE